MTEAAFGLAGALLGLLIAKFLIVVCTHEAELIFLREQNAKLTEKIANLADPLVDARIAHAKREIPTRPAGQETRAPVRSASLMRLHRKDSPSDGERASLRQPSELPAEVEARFKA